MKLLLDTHIWLWSRGQPDKLTPRVARELTRADNELWLSPISLWEVGLLVEKGRLRLDPDLEEWIAAAMRRVSVREAPVTFEVAAETARLGFAHRDPADRFLAATARVFDLTLVTADQRLIDAPGLSILANR